MAFAHADYKFIYIDIGAHEPCADIRMCKEGCLPEAQKTVLPFPNQNLSFPLTIQKHAGSLIGYATGMAGHEVISCKSNISYKVSHTNFCRSSIT